MVVNQLLMLVQAVFTQMYPIWRGAALWTAAKVWCVVAATLLLLCRKSGSGGTSDEKEEENEDGDKLERGAGKRSRRLVPPTGRGDAVALRGTTRRPPPPRRPSLDRMTSEVGFGRGKHLHGEYAAKVKTPRTGKRQMAIFDYSEEEEGRVASF